MNTFLQLEGGNLTIALFFIAIALFVSTRPFVRAQAKRFILITTLVAFSLLVAGHYYMTTKRMNSVIKAFGEGKEVECESRMNRKAAQSVLVSKAKGWKLEGYNFTNSRYTRPFHSARCIVKIKPKIDLGK